MSTEASRARRSPDAGDRVETARRPELPQAPPRPVTTWFLAALGVTLLGVLAEIATLAFLTDLRRIRQLELIWIVNYVFEQFDRNVLAAMPPGLSVPFAMDDPTDLARFTLIGLGASTLLALAIAAVAAPALALLARLSRTVTSDGIQRWLWGSALPAAAVTFFALPAIFGPVYHHFIARDWPDTAMLATVAVLGAVLWIILAVSLRAPARASRFVRRLAVAGGALALVVVAGAGGALALGIGGTSPVQPAPRRGLPNVLLISIDSLRADHLGSYGYGRETSPAIDRIAAEGALFRTAVSCTSWTLPSHLTLLNSLPPEGHGVVEDRLRLSPEVVTLPEILWQAGYATAGFVSGSYLLAEYGFDQGFDHYDDYSVAKSSKRAAPRGITSPGLVGLIERWLDRHEKAAPGRPFFVFLHMFDVHYDYAPPPPYDTMFDPDYRGRIRADNFMANKTIHPDMDPRDLEHVIALYDGEIRFTDHWIGELVEGLRRRGVYDDTVTIVTSDHGDEFFEHGNKGHQKSLYDEVLLIPLVMRYPRKIPAGTVVAEQVRLMDVAPTILSLAGIASPEGFGAPLPKAPTAERDLLPWMTRSETASLDAFGHLHPGQSAIRTPDLKLIRDDHRGRYELYDLRADPGERENRIGTAVAGEPALGQALAAWEDFWRLHQSTAERMTVSAEQIQRLRALGYVE